MSVGSFVAADYVVFVLMLVVSTAIGIYYAWASRGKESSRDFITGGRRLTALPVSMSLTANFMSSTTVLSNPAEVYCYGAIFVFFGLSYVLTTVVASEFFLPVYYRLSITSAYEYLGLRFNRATRLLGTVFFIVQTILYTGVIIYGPALALNQVTDMNLWGGIILTGGVCTIYCTLGGLKAVVWTDVFQMGIMVAGYVSVIIKAVILQGGFYTIISDSQQGGRLNFLDFDINPLRRHTFWTIVIGGMFCWISIHGTNQAQVQRYVSCKSITHARVALYISLLGLCTFMTFSVFAGMCLHSVYKNCDPWTAGLVSTPDQLMPYLVMDILTGDPGLPGLFFAAVCSGCLSTVSSSINALAAVTLEDLIKPYTNMSEKHLLWMSKGLSIFYGALCISMAGLASVLGGIMQAGVITITSFGGPILGLFTMGILCPFANSKGALSGLVSGLVASLCVSVGSLIYPPPPEMTRPLPLTTEGCNFTTDSLNWTSTALPTEPISITTAPVQNIHLVHVELELKCLLADGTRAVVPKQCAEALRKIKVIDLIFNVVTCLVLLAVNWHSPSYLYFGLIGTVTTITVGLIVSLLTGGWRTRVESRLTLMKEDTTFYHIFRFFKDRAMKRAGKLDLTKNAEKKVGNTNPAFCDTEMDFTSSNPTSNN